ncbi:MAG: hypothetical protein KA149_10725, partial [Chitinophagales bacterium]|nr:hypothetical protein [Chitinophagales bacterium]
LMRFNSERELEYWKNSAGLNHASYFVSNNPPAVTCILKTEYVPLSGAIPKQGKALAHTPASNPAYNEHQQKLAALAALYVNNPPKYFVIERRPFSSLGEPIESNGRMSIKVGGL